MKTLADLISPLERQPSQQADAVADFRAHCELAFHGALQISHGGAYNGTTERFPALREQRERVGGFKNLFHSMTRGPLWLWAKALRRWLNELPTETRNRMLA